MSAFALNERAACRRYREDAVPDALLSLLFATALAAPTKSDLQQTTIIRVKSRTTRTAFTHCCRTLPGPCRPPNFWSSAPTAGGSAGCSPRRRRFGLRPSRLPPPMFIALDKQDDDLHLYTDAGSLNRVTPLVKFEPERVVNIQPRRQSNTPPEAQSGRAADNGPLTIYMSTTDRYILVPFVANRRGG